MTAAQGQHAAERMVKKVRAEHKADIEKHDSKYAALQAQVGMLLLLCVAYHHVCHFPLLYFFLSEKSAQCT